MQGKDSPEIQKAYWCSFNLQQKLQGGTKWKETLTRENKSLAFRERQLMDTIPSRDVMRCSTTLEVVF